MQNPLQKKNAAAMKTTFEDKLAEFVWEHAVAPMGFIDRDGKFLRANPALADLLGYTVFELSHMKFHDITHPQDLEPDQEMVDACLAGKINGYTMTKRYITKRGESVWIRLRVDVVRDTDTGEFALFLSQITPKEDAVRIDTLIDHNSSVPPHQLTVAEVAAWLRCNWKTTLTVLGGLGFVVSYVIIQLVKHFGGGG